MKNLKTQLAVLLLSTLCLLTGAYAQITPLGDAYTNSADPTTNYGAQKTLNVDAAKETTYIQFNLSSIPTGASVSQATLKLYVDAVTAAGSFEVYAVNGTWTESTLTYDLAPAVGSVIDSNVPVTTADKNQYILIPMTSTVQGWVNTPSSNNGIALVAIGNFNATFDSKENTTTSHPAELDIVFAGDGTVTSVGTGTGLTGGPITGSGTISLLTSCSSGQILQWNGSAWVCSSAGAGTVTSVAAGTGLTANPSPITGSGTLSLAANACASGNALSALPFTCSPFATLGANTFTGNQTVNGNVTATNVTATQTVAGGAVNAATSFNLAGNLFAFGSYSNSNAFLGFAGNTTMTGTSNTASGYYALKANSTGNSNAAFGQGALYETTGGSNTAVGASALLENTEGSFNTASGAGALSYNTVGQNNTGTGVYAGQIANFSSLTGSNDTALGASAAFSTGTLTNATAIGANAEVAESNALVLGSINGVNGATSNVDVGIGTTAPGSTLEAYVTNNTGLGPTLTLTNGGIGSSVSSSLDFNTYPPAYGSGYNPTARILAIDDGHYSSNLIFYSNTPGYQNHGLQTTMTILSNGDVDIAGNLSKGGGSFKIDHPLDPANKYLYHSFVESPDMMNIYNGVITLDARGSVWISLPEYFEALNQDFRYQLTSIGRPQPSLYVAKEISGNRFRISGGTPGGKVSWQVTGIRHDAYADAHRVEVEVEKPPQEQGHYLHPELFGAGPEQAVGYHAPRTPTDPPTPAETAHVSSLKSPPATLK